MINLQVPKSVALKPTITVFGIGGAGGNAVNNMIASKLEGATFVVANTDAQALEGSLAENKLQLGLAITQGLGAGAMPEVGRAAAEETQDEIQEYLSGSNMVFVTAGMGGGTGTGAAPVIAKLAKDQGILTVGVVTKPFHFEGKHRMKLAESGLAELQKYVDTLIVIPNQNLFRLATERTTFADAFKMADNVLHSGVRGVTDLMVMPGLINLDFADIRTVMSEMGKAMMGTGEAEGDRRAIEAAEAAISNPLLDDVSMKGARGVLINITGGPDMTLFEVDEAANRIREEVDPEANIIFGSTFNNELEGKIRVSVVATGIDLAYFERQAMAAAEAQAATAQAAQLRQAVEIQEKASAQASVKQQEQVASVHYINTKTLAGYADANPARRDFSKPGNKVVGGGASSRFIPPRPVEPAQRQAAPQQQYAPEQQPQPRFVAEQQPQQQPRDDQQSQKKGKFDFFDRLTGRSNFGQKPQEQAKPQTAPSKPRAEALAGNEEHLEIPAYLRRQGTHNN